MIRSKYLTDIRLTKEERETIFRIDEIDSQWIADSTIQKDINKLKRMGWILVNEQFYSDGTVMAAQFKAPRKCLSMRKFDPNKPKRSLSDEHKQKLLSALKQSRNNNI